MIYLQTYEKFNVQDIMSYPTSIKNGNIYIEDDTKDYIKTLQPYYNHIKTLTNISDLTDITHEVLDDYIGFSFIMFYMKIMILSDKHTVHILINESLIPLDDTTEMLKIIESEK
jgi:hypothetical protein